MTTNIHTRDDGAPESQIERIGRDLSRLRSEIEAKGYGDAEAWLGINWSIIGGEERLVLHVSGRPPGGKISDEVAEYFHDSSGYDVDVLMLRAREWVDALPRAQNLAVQAFQRRLGELTEEAENLGLHHEDLRAEAEQIVASLRAAAQRISENALTDQRNANAED